MSSCRLMLRVMGLGNGEWETRNPNSKRQSRDLELGQPTHPLAR
jgi:hypothetical protein